MSPEQRAEIVRMALAEAGWPGATVWVAPHPICGHPTPHFLPSEVPNAVAYRAGQLAQPDVPSLAFEEWMEVGRRNPAGCADCRLAAS